eukprot:CAMPEP_0185840874 /NCGR_PEP_ID=MMETSP1353-20130828/16962_1 /TAXON_ID=1077150 /ORGANISM="Erythrolobus australicus, Strain CCMP3124" /LENGTH=122 /DNA_ID=CAMNT_0028540259 /DNA_START=162 /DNA_END=527 /DNA_ORIENTATION=-
MHSYVSSLSSTASSAARLERGAFSVPASASDSNGCKISAHASSSVAHFERATPSPLLLTANGTTLSPVSARSSRNLDRRLICAAAGALVASSQTSVLALDVVDPCSAPESAVALLPACCRRC